MKIGCSSITWASFARNRNIPQIPLDYFLAEISQIGYQGAPVSFGADQSPQATVAQMARYGLEPAPSYLGAAYWDASQEADILDRAQRAAQFMQAVGCTELFVAAMGFDYVTARGQTRRELAGQARPEDGLSPADYAQFARALNRVGEIALEHGVSICFHNHVGSVIETREEIDRLFALVDRELVFQGPDIGHLAWAGADVLSFCRDYATSIKALHIKDVDPRILRDGVQGEWGYSTFSERGIFAEIGQGCVDWRALFDILQQADYAGWVIVETDVTQKASPLESAIISREYLKGLGL